MYFNLTKNLFTKEKPSAEGKGYITILTDRQHCSTPILGVFYDGYDEEAMHLHNEDDEQGEEKALELFAKGDLNFLEHLDYFRYDNPQYLLLLD